MLSLDALREDLKVLNPQVEAADTEILAALEIKEAASLAYINAKTAVRELKAVRDPLRIDQMQLQQILGDLDPDTPDSQVLTNRGGG